MAHAVHVCVCSVYLCIPRGEECVCLKLRLNPVGSQAERQSGLQGGEEEGSNERKGATRGTRGDWRKERGKIEREPSAVVTHQITLPSAY